MDIVNLFLALVVLCSVAQGQQVEETNSTMNPLSLGQSSSGTLSPQTVTSGGARLSTLSQTPSTSRSSATGSSVMSTTTTTTTTKTTTTTVTTTDASNPASQPNITAQAHAKPTTLFGHRSGTDRAGSTATSGAANSSEANSPTVRSQSAVTAPEQVVNATTRRELSPSELPTPATATGGGVSGSVTPSVELFSSGSRNGGSAASTMVAQNGAAAFTIRSTNPTAGITTRNVPSGRKTTPTPPTPPVPIPTTLPAAFPTLSTLPRSRIPPTQLTTPSAGRKSATPASTYGGRTTTEMRTDVGSRTAVSQMPSSRSAGGRTQWTPTSRRAGTDRNTHSVPTMMPTTARRGALSSGSLPVGTTYADRFHSAGSNKATSGSSYSRRATPSAVYPRYAATLVPSRPHGTTYRAYRPRGSTANHFSGTSDAGHWPRVTNMPWTSRAATPSDAHPGSSYRVSSTAHRMPTTTMFWITNTGPGARISTTSAMKTSTNLLGFVTGWESSTKTSSKTQKHVNLLALWICLGLLLGIFAAVITACLLRNYLKKMAKWKQIQGVEKKLQDVEMVDFSTNVIYKDNKTYKDRSPEGYPTATPYKENPLFDKGELKEREGRQENLEIEYLTY